MNINNVKLFLDSNNYDIRLSRNGRWIDQKCAGDVVCFVADCIVEYLEEGGSTTFTSPDIWRSEYASTTVQDTYSKPNPFIGETEDEYNKFFRQQMKLFSAAKILNESKQGNTINFSVNNFDLLKFISLKEKNAHEFLFLYIEKTLKDSDIWNYFEHFFKNQTKESYQYLKDNFLEFTLSNTPINNEREANRIFSKVLNPLAFKLKKKGTEAGRLSTDIITLHKITYNQPNFRDNLSGKSKSIARGNYIPPDPSEEIVHKRNIEKATKLMRAFNEKVNDSNSEMFLYNSNNEKASHIHHIFPKSSHPEIAHYVENLIALTPEQHFSHAHPNSVTGKISFTYQYECIEQKVLNIKETYENPRLQDKNIYNFDNLIKVLNTGYRTEDFNKISQNDFNALLRLLQSFKP